MTPCSSPLLHRTNPHPHTPLQGSGGAGAEGLVLLAARQLIGDAAKRGLTVWLSFFELYGDEPLDLMRGGEGEGASERERRLEIWEDKEHNFRVMNLKEVREGRREVWSEGMIVHE